MSGRISDPRTTFHSSDPEEIRPIHWQARGSPAPMYASSPFRRPPSVDAAVPVEMGALQMHRTSGEVRLAGVRASVHCYVQVQGLCPCVQFFCFFLPPHKICASLLLELYLNTTSFFSKKSNDPSSVSFLFSVITALTCYKYIFIQHAYSKLGELHLCSLIFVQEELTTPLQMIRSVVRC
jgi:hypothetical protein